MDSVYDADRIFGILVRLRACLGIVAGILILVLCNVSHAAPPPARPRSHISFSRAADGTMPTPEEQAGFRAAVERASGPPPRNETPEIALGLLALLVLAITAFEFAVGSWIGNGERHGFQWGAGIEGVACLLGLFNLGSSPLAIVGFLVSLATFVYCLARLTGMGPRPI